MTDQTNGQIARRARGFTIIEILLVLLLASIFLMMVTYAFNISVRAIGDAEAQRQESVEVDRAVVSLRADIWQARSLHVDEAGALHIEGDNESAITWQWDDASGWLTRTQNDEARTWRSLRQGWSFEAEGQSVRLVVGQSAETGVLLLVPQRVVLEGAMQ